MTKRHKLSKIGNNYYFLPDSPTIAINSAIIYIVKLKLLLLFVSTFSTLSFKLPNILE